MRNDSATFCARQPFVGRNHGRQRENGEPNLDYICYQQHARWQRTLQIIGHQVAHMVFGHQGMAASDRGLARILFPHLDPQMVQRTLALSAFTDAEELEADLFASLLLERIDGPLERPSPTARQ